MIVRLTMICSGATEATRRGRFPVDEPLETRAAAKAGVASLLGRFDRLWTSPALRARQTAEVLAADSVTKEELRDQNFGEWAGLDAAALQDAQPDLMTAWRSNPHITPPGGESFAEVHRRVAAFVDGMVAQRGHTAAVTHPAVIRAAIIHVLGAPLSIFDRIDVEPLSLNDFRSDGRRWVLRGCGITMPKRRAPEESAG